MLGLIWDSTSGSLQFLRQTFAIAAKQYTKCAVAWKNSLSWDEVLPLDLFEQFQGLIAELQAILFWYHLLSDKTIHAYFLMPVLPLWAALCTLFKMEHLG